MLFSFIYTGFELVTILVEGFNQSKNMNLEPPSPRAKASSAKRGRRPGDENDAVLVTISFRRSREKRLCAILQIPNLMCGFTVGVGWIRVHRDTWTPSAM